MKYHKRQRGEAAQSLLMYAWTCTCGDGSACPTAGEARDQAELHRTRAGRMRESHVVSVREEIAHDEWAPVEG